MNTDPVERKIRHKMETAGLGSATVTAFLGALRQLRGGATGYVPESSIEPIGSLPRLEAIGTESGWDESLLRQLAVVKLNGGLGTSMGLDKAKSLLAIKDGGTFLDFIARQVLRLRRGLSERVPEFFLMNSFSTRADSLAYLERYPELSAGGRLDFLQSKVPKLHATTHEPVEWPEDPDLEWCPPGHGDIYASMLGEGLVNGLLARGIRILFVSNSDNLGATVDPRLLRYFAESGLQFLMEVAERTGADRKGGHLARRLADGRLLLRESAQTTKEDEGMFQDIGRHRFFNTNNLWIRLEAIREELDRRGGWIPLPLIKNAKTVDPKNPSSDRVLQLESAMGAAIEVFENTGAIVVPRSRFAPVKTTADLFALRSDAYEVTDDHRLVLVETRLGQPPMVELDPEHYRLVEHFERLVGDVVPSLIGCAGIKIRGPVSFAPGVRCEGHVEFENRTGVPRLVRAGTYRDQVIRVD